jgi:hypothetical protein
MYQTRYATYLILESYICQHVAPGQHSATVAGLKTVVPEQGFAAVTAHLAAGSVLLAVNPALHAAPDRVDAMLSVDHLVLLQ